MCDPVAFARPMLMPFVAVAAPGLNLMANNCYAATRRRRAIAPKPAHDEPHPREENRDNP